MGRNLDARSAQPGKEVRGVASQPGVSRQSPAPWSERPREQLQDTLGWWLGRRGQWSL